MSDNVLDRRVFLRGVSFCGADSELTGRKQIETRHQQLYSVCWEKLQRVFCFCWRWNTRTSTGTVRTFVFHMLIIFNVWKKLIFHLKVNKKCWGKKTSYKYVKGKVQPKAWKSILSLYGFFSDLSDFYLVMNPKRNDYDSSSGEHERLNHVSSHYNKVIEIF